MPKDNEFTTQDFLDRMRQWSATSDMSVGVGLVAIGHSIGKLSQSIDKIVEILVSEIAKEARR